MLRITMTGIFFPIAFICLFANGCSKDSSSPPVVQPVDSGLVNESHLDQLYVPVDFSNGTKAAGIYIYSEYPDYHLVGANGEGYTCVDDVSRAALFFLRSPSLNSDTAKQARLFNLIEFVLQMQSASGYFYNFLQQGSLINTSGPTSAPGPNWWSWRALQTLVESLPTLHQINGALAGRVQTSIQHLMQAINADILPLPKTTAQVNGIDVPQWLPGGSATDQTSPLLLGLIGYDMQFPDTTLTSFIRKLADGLVLMQQGDSTAFPYSMILSFQTDWHAYGSDQALALLVAGDYLKDSGYQAAGLRTVDRFFPWLLDHNSKSSMTINKQNGVFSQVTSNNYDQIAYGFRPMISAAAKAYKLTGDAKYADLAGRLAAWFLGANDASAQMYDPSTGICFDGISAGNSVNKNSGAESTIEALLSFQIVEANNAIKTALDKYKN